ncbi:PadR family transcriptional regulator [Frankia gtarii]|uniref:PadR family transcriptional regulator n=1 Tax=Frankia gtarii TaxID=2950102 RepID=UPI0021C1F369|nr:PadR family transcriptional regulator [Frankia gtarii]
MVRRGVSGGLSATSYAVLGLLWNAPEPLSAVELRTRANFTLRFFYWAPAVSHIRKELLRLESLELVTAEEVRLGRVRTTLVHRITPRGDEVLREWVASLPDDDPVVLKHPVILRVWLGGATDSTRLAEILDQHLARTEQVIDQLQWGQQRARESGIDAMPDSRHRRAVSGYVLRSYYAELANVRQLRDEIADRGTQARPAAAGPPPLRDQAAWSAGSDPHAGRSER